MTAKAYVTSTLIALAVVFHCPSTSAQTKSVRGQPPPREAPTPAQSSHYEQMANTPFPENYATKESAAKLMDELLFQRGVQSYLWALPAVSIRAMQEASEKTFGKGYNVLPIWKQRLSAKTQVTTPNSDVIYAMGYLDLKEDGPIVIEAPPKLQGILDDFFQRPICSEGKIDGRMWCGDVGFVGPDKGEGSKYLLLPPDYNGEVPKGYFTLRSRTYGVFVFWRGFFQSPADLAPPVDLMQPTKIYPLGKNDSAKAMQFPDASGVPCNMLFPEDGSYFEMLSRFIDHEYVDPADMDMRGMLAAIGIVKGQPFQPDAHAKEILDQAAKTAFKMARVLDTFQLAQRPGGLIYKDRQWLNVFVGSSPVQSSTFTELNLRTGYFVAAYATSPAMTINMADKGAKYPSTFRDADGDFLSGGLSYKLHLPAGIPAKIFWSVTVYDNRTASGLANGQPFPSLNAMDKPETNADGSTDVYFGPNPPKGHVKNWLRTLPGKGYFVTLRLYGPTQAYFDQSYKIPDIEKMRGL
jgi:hypothetical protein